MAFVQVIIPNFSEDRNTELTEIQHHYSYGDRKHVAMIPQVVITGLFWRLYEFRTNVDRIGYIIQVGDPYTSN